MEDKILEAFNETYNGGFTSFEEIGKGYDTTEILDTWLEYEGIVGYTRRHHRRARSVRCIARRIGGTYEIIYSADKTTTTARSGRSLSERGRQPQP